MSAARFLSMAALRAKTVALAWCLVASFLLPVVLRAHDISDQIVDIVVQPRGETLAVRVHVPAAVLGYAKLPRLDDGTLNVAGLDGPLRIVAADVARNLDIQQADQTLAAPTATASVGADRNSVDVDLTYAIQPGVTGISARLNTFPPIEQPIRTNVRFQPSSEREYSISVTGAPPRILFDPGALETFQQFVARALRAVLDGGDHLLFLLCLLIPVLRARPAAMLVGSMIAAQAITILIAVLWPASVGPWLPALAMIAASVVAIAALQIIVTIAERNQWRWTQLLAIAFGLLNGFTFGQTIANAQQFAGSHRAMAFATFLVVVIAGEVWLGALMWGTRAWLYGWPLRERIATVVASVLIAHTASERVVERGHAVAQAGSFGAERALVWLTLAWACVMLLVGVAERLRQRTIHGDRDRATNIMQA